MLFGSEIYPPWGRTCQKTSTLFGSSNFILSASVPFFENAVSGKRGGRQKPFGKRQILDQRSYSQIKGKRLEILFFIVNRMLGAGRFLFFYFFISFSGSRIAVIQCAHTPEVRLFSCTSSANHPPMLINDRVTEKVNQISFDRKHFSPLSNFKVTGFCERKVCEGLLCTRDTKEIPNLSKLTYIYGEKTSH